jgi:hypothetical protein
MKKAVFLVLILFQISFSGELFINKAGLSTYVQKAEFLVAEGENVIGPINLLPIAETNSILIESTEKSILVEGFVLEKSFQDWKKNMIGKIASIEGEGRFIKGKVMKIENNYIQVNTERGLVITTLPKFPSKISSPLTWQEIYSPRITIKLKSTKSTNADFFIKYPVKNIRWNAVYTLKIKGRKGTFYGFYNIKNETPIKFSKIKLSLIKNKEKISLPNQITIEPFTEKRFLISNPEILTITPVIKLSKKYPDGIVSVYKDGIFYKYVKLKNGLIKIK